MLSRFMGRRTVSSHLSFRPDMTSTVPFAPFEIIDGDRTKGLVLVADHAFNDLPDMAISGCRPPSSTATSPTISASNR
jgi:hypothetical protein